MKTVFAGAFGLVLTLAGSGRAAESRFVPFPVDWNAATESAVSVAFLLDSPAGKDGFITIKNGHLHRADGRRFRIWGANLTAGATLPSKEAAPKFAAHLARFGLNCVRFHFLDLPAPAGLLAKGEDSRRLDQEQLGRLDFFIAQLRQRGIYADLNLNVGRRYRPGDGVRDHELLGFAKALTYFHPRLLELQKEYAAALLTHRNPYTGNEYRQEPAVAVIESVNENSIVESWFAGRLRGKATRKNPDTWTDIPASYAAELTDLYNRSLAQQLTPTQLQQIRQAARVVEGQPLPRLTPEEFSSASSLRFQTEASFYIDLEQKYFDDMRRYLKDELGVRPLLVGTSDHNHGKSGYPLLSSTSRLDIVDGHVYWQHPKYLADPSTGRKVGFEIPNTPMVNDPLRSTVVQLSRSAMAGKPYTVSEINHPFPHEYACEGIPILAGYAGLQDWDGIFWYTLAHNQLVGEKEWRTGHFDIGPDPMKMSQLAAGAVAFLRGDVRPAAKTVTRSYSRQQVIESIRLPRSAGPYCTPGFPLAIPLIHATRISSLNGEPTGSFSDPGGDSLVSDTGEIRWTGASQKKGCVVIDTPRWQAIVGFVGEQTPATANLTVSPQQSFAAFTLCALDSQPIASAGSLLLTAAGRVATTGMKWNSRRTSLEDWGRMPMTIEPITGRLVIRDTAARRLVVQPLDGAGLPLGTPVPAARDGQDWSISLGSPPTTWYRVAVER